MQLMAKTDYNAPWADRLPGGDLLEFGPSPTTHARHLADWRNWAWRKLTSQHARTPEADRIRAWLLPDGTHIRAGLPKRELEVAVMVYLHGRSTRWVARRLEISRSTVRTYLLRLAERSEG